MSDIIASLTRALADRYSIDKPLGEGGMALVFLATDLKLGRQVAIKVLRPELAASLGAERFLHEIEVTARLQHPQILPLHEAGSADSFLYYVMPYVEGESIHERLAREGTIPLAEAIRIADDIAAALQYAHEHDVVHRDIKPENVMLTGGRAVVADFGIARAVRVAGGERLTATGLAIGTPTYMSPEQAMGAENVDARSDVYALGCVLYEMVNGKAPFEATTPQALVWKHAAEPPPALTSKDGKVPLFLKRAVDQALAKEPGDRFQTARAFSEALTSETVVSSVRHRQRRRSQVVAALAALLLVVTAGWWLMRGLDGERIERLAVLIPVNPAGSPEQEPMVQGMYHALLTELGQAGVPVIGGLQSMMRYRDTDLTVREIAAELGVDAIVEPSVFWAGDSVGIGVRLIDGETEASLWSQSYDADSRNITTLYRQVTRAIAGELQLALSPDVERRLASIKLVDPEAHQAYLQGKFHSGKLTRADLETAIDYFHQALEKDSAYAVAYAGLSWAWIAQRQMGNVPPHVATPLAVEAAQRALALDSLLAEGHHALAIAEGWNNWAWEEAERALMYAIELNPRYGDARVDYSHLLLVLKRRVEAEAQVDTALAIDPLDTKFLGFRAVIYMYTDQYDKGFADLERLLRTSPNNPAAHTVLAGVYHRMGEYDQAVHHLTAVLTGQGMATFAQALQADVAANGYHSAMRSAGDRLAQVAQATFISATVLATLYAYAGAEDEALTWLEVGLRNHNPNMPYIGVNGLFEFVEEDPRFQGLLVGMRLPWAMGG